MDLSERLHLHGAGERNHGVGDQVPRVWHQADCQENDNLQHQHHLPPMQTLRLLIRFTDHLGDCDAKRKKQQRHGIMQRCEPVTFVKCLPKQHEVACLGIGEYLTAGNVRVSIL